ncbi:hypothetical protein GAQ78_07390 [Bacteroides uniformis]|nr:hypothetical protein GAS08_09600 [Bacteroides uniformis]RGJ49311.1 hypothetical protein DXD58_14595 [Bacteroides sp. D20]KAB3921398.1 hypothetical protein GAS31_07485 [Bacteroides uniformis]KAB3928612.1 hypothetical protein GAS22_09420 [Bacteroides uniformis]KAB3933291.1 hypothetical protein GAS09_09605 [Bacteroides uniformis]
MRNKKAFFNRTFNERKDRDVFCNGKMFDRKMFLIINNDKYITLNFSSICNMCNQLKSSYF